MYTELIVSNDIKEIKKMLRAVINGQSSVKGELLVKINRFEKKAQKDRKELKGMINGLDDKLTERIDALGNQLNILDEDAPTSEELGELEKRVSKLEHQFAAN